MSDIAQDVAHGVDLDLVETDLFHFLLDAQHDFLFVAALAGDGNHVAQEACHVGLVMLGPSHDLFKGDLLGH